MSPAAWDADALVVGAGVVGLATAAALSRRGLSVMVLERHRKPGQETSSRNSEVIHAGLYYPTGSLKARLCVEGSRLLYDYCRQRGVAHRRLGKLLVAATAEEVAGLEALRRRAAENGAGELPRLTGRQVSRLEPAVRAEAGLLSPNTGIVDSHGLIKALEGELTGEGGGVVAYGCEVVDARWLDPGFELEVLNAAERAVVRAPLLVNAAGLDSDHLARLAGAGDYPLRWCKGDYFSVSGATGRALTRLIYPVPAEHLEGLGVHVTLDLGGRMRLGPDVTYLLRREQRYAVDPGKAALFLQAARRFLPSLSLEALAPDQSGIRPKLHGPGEPWRDFVVCHELQAGRPGLVNLVGLESPGLTACLALAREVVRQLDEAGLL